MLHGITGFRMARFWRGRMMRGTGYLRRMRFLSVASAILTWAVNVSAQQSRQSITPAFGVRRDPDGTTWAAAVMIDVTRNRNGLSVGAHAPWGLDIGFF